MASSNETHVLIVGAGVVGAALGQALRMAGISFQIFERDASIDSRPQGWGIGIHWALPALYSLLPEHIHPLVQAAQIDLSTPGPQQCGMLALDASNGAVRFRLPAGRRVRVRRDEFRAAMLNDLPVQWNKCLVKFVSSNSGVTVEFEDGMTATGTVLVGADGSSSQTRKLLAPDTYALNQLPMRGLGVVASYPPAQVEGMLAIGASLLQAVHPKTHVFLWWSVLETPAHTSSGLYNIQLAISWVLQDPVADEVPADSAGRVSAMKRRVESFVSPLREAVQGVPDDAAPYEIKIGDWEHTHWPSQNRGRVTLVGDAAHAMTMFRGDAANHGFMDAANLVAALKRVRNGEVGLGSAMEQYESELALRCRPAVLASRQACFDAHVWDQTVDGSPLLARGGPPELQRRWVPPRWVPPE